MLGALLAVSLAQAAVTPPPAPSDAPTTKCDDCSLTPKDEARARRLEQRLHDLDLRIATINDAWPPSAVMLMFAGVSFGPLCVVEGASMIAVAAAAIPSLLIPGIVVLVVGLVGVAVLIWGAWQASKAGSDARAEKAALLKEHDALEKELESLPTASRATPSATLFALEF